MIIEPIVLVAPTVEPLSLEEAKANLRLGSLFTADDAYITALIPVARDRAEKFCNRYFTEQQVLLVVKSGFPAGSWLTLPYPDLISVDSIKYTGTSGQVITIGAPDYTFDPETRRIYNASGWPIDAVDLKVTITTGPPVEFEGAKQAINMMLTDMYETRVETLVGQSVAPNKAVRAMLYPYRIELGI